MSWARVVLGLVGGLAAVIHAPGSLFNTAFPVQGTAVNSTNVIGAGSSSITGFNLSNGAQTVMFGNPGNTVDAGQYNDAITMYLNNSGVLTLIRNSDGFNLNSYGGLDSDTFGVSGVINLGGTPYAVIAGPASGVRALNLNNGSQTSFGGTNYVFTGARGLDAFLRPGGSALSDLAIGILRYSGINPRVDMYDANGNLRRTILPSGLNGTINDVSFDLARSNLWYGTTSGGQGKLFDEPCDYTADAVAPPVVNVTASNGQAVVNWTGRS